MQKRSKWLKLGFLYRGGCRHNGNEVTRKTGVRLCADCKASNLMNTEPESPVHPVVNMNTENRLKWHSPIIGGNFGKSARNFGCGSGGRGGSLWRPRHTMQLETGLRGSFLFQECCLTPAVHNAGVTACFVQNSRTVLLRHQRPRLLIVNSMELHSTSAAAAAAALSSAKRPAVVVCSVMICDRDCD